MWAFWGFPVSLTEVLMPLQQHFSQRTGEKQKPASEANSAKGCPGWCRCRAEEQGEDDTGARVEALPSALLAEVKVPPALRLTPLAIAGS